MLKKSTIAVIFCLVTVMLHAQWRGLRITELGTEQGFNAGVFETVEDHIGYMYFSTSQGLIRYDGSEFMTYASDPTDNSSIGSGDVYNLIVGSDSLIWLGTRFGGLISFDPRTEKFKRYGVPELPYYTVPTVHGLLEDGEGRLWAGGNHFQLLLFDREKESFTSYHPEWINPETYGNRLTIIKILQDVHNKDLLWLSVLDYVDPDTGPSIYGYGLTSFNKESKQFVSYPNSGKIAFQDQEGRLIGVGNPGKVVYFIPAIKEHITLPFKNAHDGYLTRNLIPVGDKYWITTALSIQELTPEGTYNILFEHEKKDNNHFNSMFLDKNRNVWISCSQGVKVVSPNDQYIRFYSLEIFDSRWRIYPGRLAYDHQNNTMYVAHSNINSNNRYYRIPLDADQKENAAVINLDFDVSGMAIDKEGAIWMAGGGKMYTSFNGSKPEEYSDLGFNQYTIPWLWNMRESNAGWIAGIGIESFFWCHPERGTLNYISNKELPEWNGNYHYNSRFMGFKYSRNDSSVYIISSIVHQLDLYTGKSSVLYFDRSFNPYGQEIFDVEEDDEGYLWISSVEYLGKFLKTGDSLIQVDHFSVKDGLASTVVSEIQIDDHNRLWLFSNAGINGLDPKTGEIRYFGVNEGLPQAFIDPREIIKTPDGRIITVNNTGIIEFHPDSLWSAYTPGMVPVVLKSIRINGNQIQSSMNVNYLDQLEVPLGKNVIDIAFQGLSFPEDRHLRYSYRLNQKQDWIDIGVNKFVTLPSLSPGNYIFQVKAGLPSSNSPIRSLAILVPTPFYLQVWFVLLCILGIVGGAYGIYLYRVASIRREEEKKTEVNRKIAELELKALRSQMNPHFMFNSLNSIKDYIMHARPEMAAEYLSEFAHLIRRILQNSRKKAITLREELETLMIYIELEQLRFEDKFDFNCVIDESVNLDEVRIPPMLLQPYIENAIWHGLLHKKEHGSLTLNFSKNGNAVLCTIDDDGVGRARAMELKSLSATRYKSMGMGITSDRIEIMNSIQSLGISVGIEDKLDDTGQAIGTKVVLRIPSDL